MAVTGKQGSAQLRSAAESRLAPAESPTRSHPTEADRLLHELHVHQIELEMQNEELRRTQAELQTSRDRFEALYNRVPVGCLTMNREGLIVAANQTAGALLGLNPGRLVGKRLAAFVDPPDRSAFKDYQGDVFSKGIKLACDLSFERLDGGRFPVHLESVVDLEGTGPDGKPTCCHVVVSDVSELRRTESALQAQETRTEESEARFRQIASRIDDLFYVREADGALSYASPAFERIWGAPTHTFLGKRDAWLSTVHNDDRERVALAWGRMVAGAEISETYRIRRPDGTLRWVHSRGFPVTGPDAKVVRYVGVVRDITIERQLEENLRQSQKMEAVGTLASGVAHNLRNVLQAVLTFAHIAKLKGVDQERHDNALERVATTARRGAALTDQLMMFTRRQHAVAKPLILDGAVREAADLVRTMVGEQIVVVVETGAPNGTVMGDSVQLEQIFLNLAANARDAMPGGGTLTMRTEAVVLDEEMAAAHEVASGPHIKVVVTDTGAGMDAATRARIFEPFFATKEVGQGTGLGLAMVFALTRQLGGCIEVESDVGKGTAFTLCFPSVENAAAATRPTPA